MKMMCLDVFETTHCFFMKECAQTCDHEKQVIHNQTAIRTFLAALWILPGKKAASTVLSHCYHVLFCGINLSAAVVSILVSCDYIGVYKTDDQNKPLYPSSSRCTLFLIHQCVHLLRMALLHLPQNLRYPFTTLDILIWLVHGTRIYPTWILHQMWNCFPLWIAIWSSEVRWDRILIH